MTDTGAEVTDSAAVLSVRVGMLESLLAQACTDRDQARETAEERGAMVAHLQADRARLEAEVGFLRGRVVEAERGAEQLRILLLENTKALAAVKEQQRALPAPRRWWELWRRG